MTTFAEFVNEKKLNKGALKDLLDKYDYTEDPEEIAFAMNDDKIATMGDLEEICMYLKSKKMDIASVEKKLKDALEG